MESIHEEGHCQLRESPEACEKDDPLHLETQKTGLITLEHRRQRGDLIEVFKITNGLVKVDSRTFFNMSSRQSRGHRYKLEKPRVRLDMRKHFFANRVIDAWNSLPAHAVESESINQFKAALQRLPHGAFKSWRQLPAPRGHLAN